MFENPERTDFNPKVMKKEELTQAYLHNRLNEEGMTQFTTLLETDSKFQEEVAFHKDLNKAFSASEHLRLKTKLQQFEDELSTPKQNNFKWWLAAACILAIVGFGLMTFFNNAANPDQLYMAYFEPYKNVVQPITRGESIESLKAKAFWNYEKKEYEQASIKFQKLYETTGESYYLLYEANALIAIGQTKEALPLLQKQLAFKDSFSEKSKWYLALAYLEINNLKKAKVLFKEIVLAKTYKSDAAKAILDELE